jgi:hypothetical protein
MNQWTNIQDNKAVIELVDMSVTSVVCATDWGKMHSIIIKTKLRDFSY